MNKLTIIESICCETFNDFFFRRLYIQNAISPIIKIKPKIEPTMYPVTDADAKMIIFMITIKKY